MHGEGAFLPPGPEFSMVEGVATSQEFRAPVSPK
jgi:hypothetical protein